MTTIMEPPAAAGLDLVARHQAGDRDAFAEIYRTNYGQVFRFVHFRVKNRQLAEDISQTTFTKAFARIASFEIRDSAVAAWLITIARNLVADHWKSGHTRLEIAAGDIRDNVEREDHSPEGRPESAVINHLTNRVLLDAVKLLTPEQRECLVLRFLRGLSVDETARVMGRELGAVKALQYRAVRALSRDDDLQQVVREWQQS